MKPIVLTVAAAVAAATFTSLTMFRKLLVRTGLGRRKGVLVRLCSLMLVGGALTFAASAQATFPGANGKIAFAGNATGDYEVYSINPDGTGLTNLSNTPGFDDFWPAWSPDGERIVFVSVPLNGTNFQIYVMNSDGSGRQRLTNNSAVDNFPSWSPDGRRILFRSNRDGNREIYVMWADGSNQTRLTNYPGVDFTARYHPEGDKIVFDRAPGDGNAGPFAVYTMRPDGTGIRKLTEDGLQAGAPDWSPGGDRIVFENNNCFTCPNSDLFTMSPAGRHLRQLTSNFGNNLYGHFSPDGRTIAFTHSIDFFSNADIYTMNADGSGRVNITNTPTVDEFGSDWQPVGDGGN